jgi:hypothetical protein
MGFLGRPGMLRVYFPLACFLVVAPLLSPQIKKSWRRQASVVVLTIAAALNLAQLFPESKEFQRASEAVREGLREFPNYAVVDWGGGFPYEAVYPVLKPVQVQYRISGLGVFTLAPFSVAYHEMKAGRGITNLLISEMGLPVITSDKRLGFLDAYCREHFHGFQTQLPTQEFGQVQIRRPLCKAPPTESK